jgi:hypothetical protein
MQASVHTHFLPTLVRINALWINNRAYSIATDVGNGLISKHFRLSLKLLGDSALATVLILGFVFGSIQSKYLDKCIRFYALYKEFVLCSIPLSGMNCSVHAWTERLIYTKHYLSKVRSYVFSYLMVMKRGSGLGA